MHTTACTARTAPVYKGQHSHSVHLDTVVVDSMDTDIVSVLVDIGTAVVYSLEVGVEQVEVALVVRQAQLLVVLPLAQRNDMNSHSLLAFD